MIKINKYGAIIACAAVLPALANEAVQPPLQLAQTSVPAGFEELLAPQQSVVDVYFGGRFVDSVPVTYTPYALEFHNPDILVQKIPALLNAESVRTALYGELDSHSEAICQNERDTGCGIIEPDIAGVIFDEYRYRADLFIHPDYLAMKTVDLDRYLPESSAGVGLMQNMTANVSGDINGQNDTNYTVIGNTFLSLKENNLQANWDISRDQNVSFNQLVFERDYQGKQLQAGLIFGSGFGLSFSQSSRIWGARFASSYNTRTDQAFTQGTPLEVFMPVRGRYEIIYEERLIGSGFLEAGNQALDTSVLPGGAYDLTIRLLDQQGNLISEESRFYARQSRLAPAGEPEYFLEGGRVALTGADRVLPDLTETMVVRGGVNMRFSDTWSGTFATAATPGQTLGESSFFNLGRNYELSGGLMYGGHRDLGVRGEGRYRLGALSLSANYLQLWRSTYTANSEIYDLLGNDFRQVSFSANYPLFGGSASYRFSDSENLSNDNEISRQIRQTLAYSRPVYRDNLYYASLRFDTSWTDQGNITGLLTVELRRTSDNWTLRAAPISRFSRDTLGASDTEHSLQVGATYDDRDTFAGNLRSSFQAETSSNQTSAGLSTRYGSTWGSGNLNLNYADNGNTTNTTYAASLTSSLTASADGIAFGGETQSRAAVVVDVEGAGLRDGFDVFIDGRRRGYALGGKPSIIHLSPYQTYKVRIRPRGETLFSFDEKEYEVTLYPGNVTSLNFEMKQVVVVYGRVRMPDGDWLSHASIQGGEGLAVSDEYGVFQAEVLKNTSQLMFNRRGAQCILPLKPDIYDEDFINLGQVVCQ